MTRVLSPAQKEALEGKHRRGGPHRAGTKRGRADGKVRIHRRPPLCPACGRDNGDFGTLHPLTGRAIKTAGYKRLSWENVELLASERIQLIAQIRRALAALEAEG